MMKAKNDLWFLLLQTLPVMLGVYLGFWLSERGEQKHTDQQVDKLETLIINEIESNRSEVTKKLKYHEMLLDTLNVLKKGNNIDRSRLFNTFKGINPPRLKNACYQSGIQTGLINNFELEEVTLLNEIMAEQESLDKYSDAAIAALLTTGTFGDEGFSDILGRVVMNLNDITSFEGRLLRYYDSALEVMQ